MKRPLVLLGLVIGCGQPFTPVAPPPGSRDGAPCYTAATGPNRVAPPERRTFDAPNLAASSPRLDTSSAFESHVAISPTGAVVTAYIAANSTGGFIGASATRDGATMMRVGAIRDAANRRNADPVLAYTRDGVLHASFIGVPAAGTTAGARVRLAESTDDGTSWTEARGIDPDGLCADRCDKPWMVAGPAPSGAAGESLYVAYFVQGAPSRLVAQRSDDAGRTFTAPLTIATTESIDGARVAPQLVTLALGVDGTLHAAYVGDDLAGDETVAYGHAGNRILYRTSIDGAQTWSAASRVSRTTDAAVLEQPGLAIDGAGVAHVAYVNRDGGAWDIVLASSGAVGWTHRRVNDEPDACALHDLPALVADPARGLVHVVWMENRLGPAGVGYAACPASAAAPCAANERVDDEPSDFVIESNASQRHADYIALALTASGDLWATWTDHRTGADAIYLSRGRPR